MHRLIRSTAAAFLLTLLFSLPALARPAVGPESWAGPGLFAAFWERVASLLGMFDESRGNMDPDGTTTSATPPDDGESRGGMDPNGVTAKSRGTMDPDGATVTATPPDDGESRGSFDPNG